MNVFTCNQLMGIRCSNKQKFVRLEFFYHSSTRDLTVVREGTHGMRKASMQPLCLLENYTK
jgi:hypothetical protein